jgi:hypothetical protein
MKGSKRSACPNCGDVATRTVYDIGSGPEVSCASCEWCWGANGQPLKPLAYADVVRDLGFDPMDGSTWPAPDPSPHLVAQARAEALHEQEPE